MRVRRLPSHCHAAVRADAGAPLDGVRVEVEGDLDPDGFTGKAPDVRNGLQEVRFRMHLKSEDGAAARALAALVEERCPVSDCLKAPVPVVCAEVVVE